jgi:hypothetical protein
MSIIEKLQKLFYQKKEPLGQAMVRAFSPLFVKIYIAVLLVLNAFIWYLAYFIYKEVDTELIALHYNVDFGIDYYGSSDKIFYLPFIGLLISLINFSVYASSFRHKDKKFIAHVLLATAIISNILILLSTISVYIINFR